MKNDTFDHRARKPYKLVGSSAGGYPPGTTETSWNVTRYPPVSLTLGRLSAYMSSGKGRSHWQDPAGRVKAHAPTPDRAPFIYIYINFSNLSQPDLSWSFARTERRKIKLLNNIMVDSMRQRDYDRDYYMFRNWRPGTSEPNVTHIHHQLRVNHLAGY